MRATDHNIRTELGQQQDVGPRHSRVQHVSHDGDARTCDGAMPPNRESVEQGLGRMLVLAVPGVDDGALAVPGEKMRRPCLRVANHDEGRRHREQIARGIQQALAFDEARGGRGEIHRVGREALFGQLERGSCPGGRLDEEVDHGLAAQRGDFLDLTCADLREALGSVQDQ